MSSLGAGSVAVRAAGPDPGPDGARERLRSGTVWKPLRRVLRAELLQLPAPPCLNSVSPASPEPSPALFGDTSLVPLSVVVSVVVPVKQSL